MMNIEPTVTLLICAFNEQANIQSLLKALLKQKKSSFILENIIIISDGSTDNTQQEVVKINNPLVILKNYKERKGKAYRLTQHYKSIKTTLLVQIDGDVVIEDIYFLEKLIAPLIRSKKIGMSGAHSLPLPGKTFVEKAVNSSVRPYVSLRQQCPSLSIGPVLAYKTTLIKDLKYPVSILGEDIYSYFYCLTNNYFYSYVRDAIVYYRSPNNLKDHIRQNVRFLSSPYQMSEYFSKELVQREDRVPKLLYLKALLSEFLRHPVLSITIFVINKLCLLIALFSNSEKGNWNVSQSTKLH